MKTKLAVLAVLALTLATSGRAEAYYSFLTAHVNGKNVTCCVNSENQPGGTTSYVGSCPTNTLICSGLATTGGVGGTTAVPGVQVQQPISVPALAVPKK